MGEHERSMTATIHNLRTPVDKSAAWHRVRAGRWELRDTRGFTQALAVHDERGWTTWTRKGPKLTGPYDSMDAAMLAAGKG